MGGLLMGETVRKLQVTLVHEQLDLLIAELVYIFSLGIFHV
jgi:hypothetical protein